ncbi:RNA polymerase II transcription factor SIII subunit A-domain-containing protein [Aspergillus egyptiacus]|nr:RNA polymerase II transcription factor SIII subunit A-domain-containing protein [Aspergillus egyptiacus]
MAPPTLRYLCTATAVRNVKCLNDIGNIPYALARPFLLKIESPEKLRSLELQSPHIMQDDGELWIDFIKRDIPRWEEIALPEQPDCWYDIYCDLREQVQREVDEDAEKLKMALDGISSERAKHSAKFVTDRREIRLPRERPTAKQRYATFDRKMGGLPPVFSSKPGKGSPNDPMGTPVWTFERPSVPRSQTPKRNNIFTAKKRNNVLAVPTKQLNNRATQIRQAPRSLIEQHRRPPEPAIARMPTLRAPGRSSLQRPSINIRKSSSPPALSSSLQEKEARLRAIASGRAPTSSLPRTSQASSAARPSLASSSTSPARHPSGSLPTLSSLPRVPSANRTDARSSESAANMNPDESKMSPSRPAPVRKRPPPNVFIQSKKKKLT